MSLIRTLIVSDSPTIRFLIDSLIAEDTGLSVVGESGTVSEILALCQGEGVDILVLHVETTLQWEEVIGSVMAQSPRPIIVLMPEDETDLAKQARDLGALLVVNATGAALSEVTFRQGLIWHIRTMAGVKVVGRRRKLPPDPGLPMESSRNATDSSYRLIGIGSSTGGPPALQKILLTLPAPCPVPIVVVQHISQGFVVGLARWLSETTPFVCEVATHNQPMIPGRVYFAPDQVHLQVKTDRMQLAHTPPVGVHLPSVTALFASLARHYAHQAIGVLLTGMGDDGAAGLLAMRQAGCPTIVQDEATSVIFGMPRCAIALGAAELVLPLEQIGPQLENLIRKPSPTPRSSARISTLQNRGETL